MRRTLACVIAVAVSAALHAQNNRIDTVSPSAPELAAYGPLAIGVRTIEVTDTEPSRHPQHEGRRAHGPLRPHVDAGGLVSGHARGRAEAGW